jgi:hypothetical protein
MENNICIRHSLNILLRLLHSLMLEVVLQSPLNFDIVGVDNLIVE